MSAAQIHLIFNHYPVILALVALVLLGFGQRPERTLLLKAGLWVALAAAVTLLPAYFSGEGAEEIVEDMPHVSHPLIREHEEMAEKALIVFMAMGGAAIAGLVRGRRGHAEALLPARLTMVGWAVGLVLAGYTANLGGKIAHPEMRNGTPAKQAGHEEQQEHEHAEEHEEED